MTDEGDKPRLADRLKAAGQRGRVELTREDGLPRKAGGAGKRWIRGLWEVRGGGLYALGFIVTFLYLEIREFLLDDIPQLYNLSGDFVGGLISFAIDFFIDTLMNTIAAFMWPYYLATWESPFGVILLVAAFLLFPMFVKEPLEHWLFDGKPPEPEKKEKDKKVKQKDDKRSADGASKRQPD